MTRHRDPKVSFRAPEELVAALDETADGSGVQNRSALIRMCIEYGLATNADQLGVAARIDERRREIIDKHRPVDLAEGLPGRVEDQMSDRFVSGYSIQGLARKAESYVEEAEMYEEELDGIYREGELVDRVKEKVRETLEAADLTNWFDRNSNPYERFEGVADALERRRFALVLLQNALELDDELEPLRSVGGERRVHGGDLPELAEDDLPRDVGRDDVAEVARQLADQGVRPEDVETDPQEFDPFGWRDVEVARVDADGSVALASADGGQRGLPEPEPERVESEVQDDETTEDDADADPNRKPNMDYYNPEKDPSRDEIVNGLAELYDDLGGGVKARRMVRASLTDSNQADEHGYRYVTQREGFDVDALVAEAVEKADTAAPEEAEA